VPVAAFPVFSEEGERIQLEREPIALVPFLPSPPPTLTRKCPLWQRWTEPRTSPAPSEPCSVARAFTLPTTSPATQGYEFLSVDVGHVAGW